MLEEMRRTLRFFLHWRNIWHARGREREHEDELGAAAYARRCGPPAVNDDTIFAECDLGRQAHRYSRLKDLCVERFGTLIDKVCSMRSHDCDSDANVLQDAIVAEFAELD